MCVSASWRARARASCSELRERRRFHSQAWVGDGSNLCLIQSQATCLLAGTRTLLINRPSLSVYRLSTPPGGPATGRRYNVHTRHKLGRRYCASEREHSCECWPPAVQAWRFAWRAVQGVRAPRGGCRASSLHTRRRERPDLGSQPYRHLSIPTHPLAAGVILN